MPGVIFQALHNPDGIAEQDSVIYVTVDASPPQADLPLPFVLPDTMEIRINVKGDPDPDNVLFEFREAIDDSGNPIEVMTNIDLTRILEGKTFPVIIEVRVRSLRAGGYTPGFYSGPQELVITGFGSLLPVPVYQLSNIAEDRVVEIQIDSFDTFSQEGEIEPTDYEIRLRSVTFPGFSGSLICRVLLFLLPVNSGPCLESGTFRPGPPSMTDASQWPRLRISGFLITNPNTSPLLGRTLILQAQFARFP
ncbi:MAG: hypothetical protein IID17_14825 [Nitrospinae bacterium]|nr:hypothetical protein [Nitrospinota bacterium]